MPSRYSSIILIFGSEAKPTVRDRNWADQVAEMSPWLAVVLTGYFILRAAPLLATILLLISVLLGAVWQHSRAHDEPTPDKPAQRGVAFWMLSLVCAVVCVYPIANLVLFGGGDSLHGGLGADEAYELMIAQALKVSFPPIDLTYDGSIVKYHLGGALLVDLLSRLTGLPTHTSFYTLYPLVTLVTVACAYRLIGLIRPTWPVEYKLGCLIAGFGFLTVDVHHLVWNLRNSLLTGDFQSAMYLHAEPIFALRGIFQHATTVTSPLGLCFMFILLANLHRGAVVTGSMLFAMFLAKSSIAVPVFVAWLFFAPWRAFRGQAKHLLAGAISLVLVIWSRQWVMESNIASLRLSPDFGLDRLAEVAQSSMEWVQPSKGILAASLGAILAISSFHVYLVGTIYLAFAGRRTQTHDFSLLLIGCCTLVLAFFGFELSENALRGFHATHQHVAHDLWLPYANYLPQIWDIALVNARHILFHVVPFVGAVGLWEAALRARSSCGQVAQYVVFGLAFVGVGSVAYRTLWFERGLLYFLEEDAVTTLGVVPVAGAVVMTNDLQHAEDIQQTPMMNAKLSAIFGHQFWLSNLMYNTYAEPDAAERLRAFNWFWAAPFSTAHCEFMQRRGISHVLVNRRYSSQKIELALEATPLLDTLRQTDRYSVFMRGSTCQLSAAEPRP